MKKSLLDYYKMKYGAGGKVPVRKTGMWYQEGDVVVPSNEITMEGPQEQPDYFKEPILGIGIPSGKVVKMMPGGKYKFPGDKAVYETKKYQTGKPVKNPSSGFSWYANKPTSLVSPSKSQIAAAQGQQRSSTTVTRPVSNAAQLKLQQNAQTTKNIKESVKEIYKEIQEEKEAEKAAMQPTTEDIVRQSNIAREKILSGDVTMDNISDWFAAAPEKLKLSSPYSVLTPGLNKKIPESLKPVTDFFDNYVNPISFGGSFWSNAAQAGSDFSKGKGEEGINSALRATLVPAGMLLGQKIAPGLHTVEKGIGQGIQRRVGNIGASAVMNSGPLGTALVTGLARAAVGAGKAGTKAGIQAGEKVGVHTASLPSKEYQKGDIVTNTPISEEIMRRFMVRPEFTNQDFTLPSFIDASTLSSIAKTMEKYKNNENLSNESTYSDISSEIMDKAKKAQVNLDINKRGRIGNINITGNTTVEELAKKQFNPVDVNAGLNLGPLGKVNYSGQINKGDKLKEVLKPENFVYSNAFNNGEIGGNITYVPTKSLSATLASGKDIALGYNTTKGEDGQYKNIRASFNPGIVSLDYDQSYGPDKKIISQNIKGGIGDKNTKLTAYRNVSAEEGKNYGGKFSKNKGAVKYGASADYGNEGLRSLIANLNANDQLMLNYKKRVEDGQKYTDVSGSFNPGTVSLDFAQSYGPDKKITKQNIKGSIKGEKGNISAYRNIGEEGKTYGGSFAKTSGDVTYSGDINYGPEGLQNIGGNLTASDLFNLTYARNREGEGFTNTIGAELMPGQPFSINFNRTYDNQGMNETTVGGNLNLKNLQAGLSKTFTPEGSTMQGNVNANIGKRVTLGATGDFTNNRLNKLGLRTGVNILPGFSINAGVEKEIGTGKPKFTFQPKVTKEIVNSVKKKKAFVPLSKDKTQPSEEDMQVFQVGGKKAASRSFLDILPNFVPYLNDAIDIKDIFQGGFTGNTAQMNQGIIGLAAPGLAGKGLGEMVDYFTEKTVSKQFADEWSQKRNDIVNMSDYERRELFKRYGGWGAYDRWVKAGKPKLKKGGKIEYEEEEEEDDDREMVEGIADILTKVKDKKNRKQIAKEMVDDFEEEDVDYNLDDFMEAAKLMQGGGMSIPRVNGSVVASSPTNLKMAYMKKGGQHGGLDRWFAEKWVDVKTGKACGRQEGENRAYPACRPSKRVSSKTPKTSSELSSKEKARFKATKTSSQRIPYNHKRK